MYSSVSYVCMIPSFLPYFLFSFFFPSFFLSFLFELLSVNHLLPPEPSFRPSMKPNVYCTHKMHYRNIFSLFKFYCAEQIKLFLTHFYAFKVRYVIPHFLLFHSYFSSHSLSFLLSFNVLKTRKKERRRKEAWLSLSLSLSSDSESPLGGLACMGAE